MGFLGDALEPEGEERFPVVRSARSGVLRGFWRQIIVGHAFSIGVEFSQQIHQTTTCLFGLDIASVAMSDAGTLYSPLMFNLVGIEGVTWTEQSRGLSIFSSSPLQHGSCVAAAAAAAAFRT